MPLMKPSFSIVVLACATLAACSPSPYYTGNSKGGLAPGAVPRDGLGRPVLEGKAIEYAVPPPTAVAVVATPAQAKAANAIIYFQDLTYAGQPQRQVAGNQAAAQTPRP